MSPDLGVGRVDDARMTPKFDFRAAGKAKMAPKFDARGSRKGKTTHPNLTSELPEGENDPPNSMLGVVGRVKRTPRFKLMIKRPP